MSHEDHKSHAPASLGFGVVTISDTRTKEDDDSGRMIIDLLKEKGHEVRDYEIVKDDYDSIKRAIVKFARNADVVVTNGGTGISRKDVTYEVVSSLLDKKLDGFGELFRSLSHDEIGSAAIMSRTIAGVYGDRIIICIPGSPKAVELAMKRLILPEVGHMIWEARR
jgi:molybdenum cofactor biosynthesis protein B